MAISDDDRKELIGQMMDIVQDMICREEVMTKDEYDVVSQKFEETLVNWNLLEPKDTENLLEEDR